VNLLKRKDSCTFKREISLDSQERIYPLGTSSWTGEGWVGSFYPPTAKPQDFPSTYNPYFEIIPIVFSHVSTNWGHRVIGSGVRRSPNACPPCAYKWIFTGTPAFFSAM
jgi:hypothetical protein